MLSVYRTNGLIYINDEGKITLGTIFNDNEVGLPCQPSAPSISTNFESALQNVQDTWPNALRMFGMP